jgi:hypothetical protein
MTALVLMLALIAAAVGILNLLVVRILATVEENTDAAAYRGELIVPKVIEQAELALDEVNLLDALADELAGAVQKADHEHDGEADGRYQMRRDEAEGHGPYGG